MEARQLASDEWCFDYCRGLDCRDQLRNRQAQAARWRTRHFLRFWMRDDVLGGEEDRAEAEAELEGGWCLQTE